MQNSDSAPEGYDHPFAAGLSSAFTGAKGGNTGAWTYDYYDPKESSSYANKGVRSPEAPAPLTDLPTSTTNPVRPRTVAAGYDENRGVMTVVFRDGTIYNYYNVTADQWIGFHESISKGRPWLNNFGPGTPGEFVKHPHGPADMSGADPEDLKTIYRVVRDAQVRYQTKRKYKVSNPNGVGYKLQTRVTNTASAKAKLNKMSAGKNPATANKPHKPHKP